MTSGTRNRATITLQVPYPLIAFVRLLASLKLAVLLIVIVAAVLAWATFFEAGRGREYVQWYVYDSQWLVTLLALLAANMAAAMLVRFPWKKRQVGFLVTHAGVLVLLAGAMLTTNGGFQGQMPLREGQANDGFFVTDRCQLTIRWPGAPGEDRPLPAAFIFRPGPVDWPEGESLDLGELSGVRLKVLKYYAHARVHEDWVADESHSQGPAMKFALAGADGKQIVESWLVADQFGGEAIVGPTRFQLQCASVATMLEDFLKPPAPEVDKDGVLSMHYEGHVERVPVSSNLGKKLPLGTSGLSVEIAEYLPNAKPSSGGRFTSQGEEPKNPFLELCVYLPGNKEPLRQIAFAANPLLNLEGVHGRALPVKFWYHHPAVVLPPGADFMRLPDGTLHCRALVDGKYQPRGVVKEGDSIELAGKFKLSIVNFLEHARAEVTFLPDAPAEGESEAADPAALVEVEAGDGVQQVWLRRNDEAYGEQTIATKQGRLGIRFGYEYRSLDFALKLLKFTHGLNPGGMGDASFSSLVQVVDRACGVDQQQEISMNHPLLYRGFTFYQASCGDNDRVSVLGVAHDPGRLLKYIGSLMLCGGIALAFAVHALRRKKTSQSPNAENAACVIC